jgi:scaffold protein (connect acetoacetyl-CoA thiolase and HMG-CoA synthase)
MSVPRYWREEKPRYRLTGEECTKCGTKHYPKTPVCTCGSTEFKPYKLAEMGTVESWTVIRNAPLGYERFAPYVVALIELDDGVRILSQVVDIEPEAVKAGMKVEYAFRKVTEDGQAGLIQYGYKFRPVVD